LHLQLQGTNFQVRVWEALLRIPAGQVASYDLVAEMMGEKTAVRAVASAVARNPIGYLIPCHRVIRKTGAFGQYHWGETRKKAILAWEAARR
ncbi:MAG: methylated-DNA--[protein]-cysteine S-methyltransferase, partial [Anaerolineales bacterium]|nr:methylated-DNA--[protein]-cysteine S-methyltransferase [Anaerolineales bacterium]